MTFDEWMFWTFVIALVWPDTMRAALRPLVRACQSGGGDA